MTDSKRVLSCFVPLVTLIVLNFSMTPPGFCSPASLNSGQSAIKLISDCASLSPLSKTGVEKVLGVSLQQKEKSSDEVTFRAEAPPGKPFSSVEFLMRTDPEFSHQDVTFAIAGGVVVTQKQLENAFGMPRPRVEFLPHRNPAGYQYIYRYKNKTVAATFDASSKPKGTQIDAAREITVTTLKYSD